MKNGPNGLSTRIPYARVLSDASHEMFTVSWSRLKVRVSPPVDVTSGSGIRVNAVTSSPSFVWKDIKEAPYRKWLVAFGSELMNLKLDFWYDQFLAKPPGKSVPTYWHQDEGYWGTNLFDKGITCWIPLQDVNAQNGCMHFVDRGHKDGVLPHHLVEGMASDLLTCEVDESRTIVCPIKRGSVTFHHSKTPHMTTANTSQGWRKAVTNHMQMQGAGGEGGHYPWKIYVNQRTGERIVPKKEDGVPDALKRR